jgi:hypothetical protein
MYVLRYRYGIGTYFDGVKWPDRLREKARYNETILVLLIHVSDEQIHVAIKWKRSSCVTSGLGLVLSEQDVYYESVLSLMSFSLSCTVIARIARSQFMLESLNTIECWKESTVAAHISGGISDSCRNHRYASEILKSECEYLTGSNHCKR